MKDDPGSKPQHPCLFPLGAVRVNPSKYLIRCVVQNPVYNIKPSTRAGAPQLQRQSPASPRLPLEPRPGTRCRGRNGLTTPFLPVSRESLYLALF